MKDFFDLSIKYGNAGFGLFTGAHFAYLLLSAMLALALCLAYKKASPRRRRVIRVLTASSALALELLRAIMLALGGQYDIGRLPLHLCGMAAYISFFHSLRAGKLSGQFLYAFCMPGAAAALLFPDWSYYPFWHFMSLCGFALHALIAGYTLMQVVSGDIVPDIRRAPACFAIMLALAIPVYIFDVSTGMNYMFLNWPSAGSPLEWFAFLGRPGYVLGYLPMIAAVWALLYYPFRKKSAD